MSEEVREPGNVMPEPGMSEEEWQAKNWPYAVEDAEQAEVMARAGYVERNQAQGHKEIAKREQDLADEEHPLLHLSREKRSRSKILKTRHQAAADAHQQRAQTKEERAELREDAAGWQYEKEQRDAVERVVGEKREAESSIPQQYSGEDEPGLNANRQV